MSMQPPQAESDRAERDTQNGRAPQPLRSYLRPIKPRPGASITVVGPPACPKCRDVQYFSYPDTKPGDPLFGELMPCPYCHPCKDSRVLQERSGLTAHEQNWRLSDLDSEGRPAVKRLVDECRQLVHGERRILTVWGPCGNGKTLALQAAVNEMVQCKVPAIYLTAKELLDRLRAAMEPGSAERPEKRLERLASTTCLALDEFDKVAPSQWVTEQLTYLIDRRHRGSEAGTHATLIAMNEDPARLEPWIASRLLAGCNRVVHTDTGDLRPALTQGAP